MRFNWSFQQENRRNTWRRKSTFSELSPRSSVSGYSERVFWSSRYFHLALQVPLDTAHVPVCCRNILQPTLLENTLNQDGTQTNVGKCLKQKKSKWKTFSKYLFGYNWWHHFHLRFFSLQAKVTGHSVPALLLALLLFQVSIFIKRCCRTFYLEMYLLSSPIRYLSCNPRCMFQLSLMHRKSPLRFIRIFWRNKALENGTSGSAEMAKEFAWKALSLRRILVGNRSYTFVHICSWHLFRIFLLISLCSCWEKRIELWLQMNLSCPLANASFVICQPANVTLKGFKLFECRKIITLFFLCSVCRKC